jgi:hypothetical protein
MCAFYQLINKMCPKFGQYCFLFLLCFSFVAKGAETVVASDVVTSATAQAAIKQAEKLQLAQHETWLALLHCKRETVLGRFISQADDAVAGFDMEKNHKFSEAI